MFGHYAPIPRGLRSAIASIRSFCGCEGTGVLSTCISSVDQSRIGIAQRFTFTINLTTMSKTLIVFTIYRSSSMFSCTPNATTWETALSGTD